MLISWVNVFQFLLTILSLILGYYILSTKRCYALAGHFFLFAIHNLLRMSGEILDLDVLISLSNTLRFLYAPLVYFAVKELLYQDFTYQQRHIWHVIPFFIALFITSITSSANTLFDIGISILIPGYVIVSYYLLFKFKTIVENTRSSGTPSGVFWLTRTLHIYSALIVFEIIRSILDIVFPQQLYEIFQTVFVVTVCTVLSLLVYQGMRSPSLLPRINHEEKTISANLESDNRPKRTLNPEVEKQLAEYMSAHKPYLNPTISVKELADDMTLSPRILSEVINDYYHCNFSEFINKARVDESQHMMASDQWKDKSLLDIGLAAGFNSKTSFNVMFKRYTNDTPSNYRKRIALSNS